MTASYQQYILEFKRPSGTSRGVLTTKETWFLLLQDGTGIGIGECGILRTLSIDDRPDYEQKLQWVCEHIHLGEEALYNELTAFPSIQFGVEMAFKSLRARDPFILFPSDFTKGIQDIPINGLIWMGEKDFMKEQITQKLAAGFQCIKMKIGAIDFDTELSLLAYIRSQFSSDVITLRVDANGAFSPSEALTKLTQLQEFSLHSIEQPIKQGQTTEMKSLCKETPLPIALDEELIGIFAYEEKKKLLETIRPQYIILKPSLIGGFRGSMEWIRLAESMNIGWWITSALESNIGLNAISQFTYTLENDLPQGLGTGGLYTNNIPSPLVVSEGGLRYDPEQHWEFDQLIHTQL